MGSGSIGIQKAPAIYQGYTHRHWIAPDFEVTQCKTTDTGWAKKLGYPMVISIRKPAIWWSTFASNRRIDRYLDPFMIDMIDKYSLNQESSGLSMVYPWFIHIFGPVAHSFSTGPSVFQIPRTTSASLRTTMGSSRISARGFLRRKDSGILADFTGKILTFDGTNA